MPEVVLTLTQQAIAVALAIAVSVGMWWVAFRLSGEHIPYPRIVKTAKFAVITVAIIVGVGLLFFFLLNWDKFDG